MKTLTNETTISKDLANRKLLVEREFDAPVEKVWKAWTDSNLLDQWWAPKPWKANTKSMDFREGGFWLYYMEGPEGEKHYARADYKSIDPNRSFALEDMFCDENGNKVGDMPSMRWDARFSPTETGTKVEIEITFDSIADLDKIVEMGFKEGFTAAHANLDELLAEENGARS